MSRCKLAFLIRLLSWIPMFADASLSQYKLSAQIKVWLLLPETIYDNNNNKKMISQLIKMNSEYSLLQTYLIVEVNKIWL